MTVARKLRPATIIPETLYVSRKADRQLDMIVSDMGRPGYVLVARQMGKTNMLIHMKRRRERLGEVVAYVDLSNRHSDASGLFRSVIDTLIDSGGSKFRGVVDVIQAERSSDISSPAAEYDRHLRLLLSSIKDNVVIILDEIDSLINAVYSDTVLAQIRSMYFARATYPVYERLTYVLSGVAEPSELIKDKTISPFNIGEKIYLDDFSREEVGKLFSAAELSLPKSVFDRIYYWTKGNPRMTWDVASSVETRLTGGVSLTPDDIDDLVRHLFLESFDRAPVDHIRTLAESDALVRDGVVALRYGKASTLPEKTISKLYLAGIIGAGQPSVLKNPIIDEALSDAWLDKIVVAQKSLLEAAGERYFAQDFAGALRLFAQYELSGAPEGFPPTSLAERGVSKFQTGDFAGAAADLELARPEIGASDLGDSLTAYLAGAWLRLEKTQSTIDLLERAGTPRSSALHLTFAVTLTSAYLAEDAAGYADEIIQRLTPLITDTDPEPEQPGGWVSGTYNLTRAYLANGEQGAGLRLIKRAIAKAPLLYQPALNLYACRLTRSRSEKAQFALRAATSVLDLPPPRLGEQAYGLEYAVGHIAPILTELLEAKLGAEFDQLLSYAAKISEAPGDGLALVMWLYQAANGIAEAGSLRPLLTWAISSHLNEQTPNALRFAALREHAVLRGMKGRSTAEARFAEEFASRAEDGDYTEENILGVLSYTANLVQSGSYQKVLSYVQMMEEKLHLMDSMSPIISVIVLQQLLMSFKAVNKSDDADRAAHKLIRRVDVVLKDDADTPFKSVISNQKTFAERHLASRLATPRSSIPGPSFDHPWRGVGRNELVVVRFPNGLLEMTRKLKFVERDLVSGELEWVRRANN